MKKTVFLALAFALFTTPAAFAQAPGKSIAEKNADDRCFVLNFLAKKHAGLVREGSSAGDLRSMIANLDSFTHVAKVELPKPTQERLFNLKQVQADLEKDLFKGDAKAKALRTTFYEMNSIVKNTITEAHILHPECRLLQDTSAPKAATPAPSRGSGSSVK